MTDKESQLTVYYDGACPGCIRDMKNYQKLAGGHAASTRWVDITDKNKELRSLGIDPISALRELHVVDAHGKVYRELDAYILLMRRTIWLTPLGWFIGLPGVRQLISRWYRWWVDRRLCRTGRL